MTNYSISKSIDWLILMCLLRYARYGTSGGMQNQGGIPRPQKGYPRLTWNQMHGCPMPASDVLEFVRGSKCIWSHWVPIPASAVLTFVHGFKCIRSKIPAKNLLPPTSQNSYVDSNAFGPRMQPPTSQKSYRDPNTFDTRLLPPTSQNLFR